MNAVDVFTYLDYRELLADYYRTKKGERRGFSYRVFSRRAGLGSPNHLKRVIDGERNLSAASTAKYVHAMDLRGDSAEYFSELVRFSQARTVRDREKSYERMRSFRGYQDAHLIDEHYADLHAHWYVPAIREMVLRSDFKNDAAWVAKNLRPAIRKDQAQHALQVLFELGMLVVDRKKRVRQSDEAVITTGPQTRGLHIAKYHRVVLERAAASIDLVPADQRYLSALTFCVAPGGFERSRERIQRFRNELLASLDEEGDGLEVLQLGIQLFPMSTRRVDS